LSLLYNNRHYGLRTRENCSREDAKARSGCACPEGIFPDGAVGGAKTRLNGAAREGLALLRVFASSREPKHPPSLPQSLDILVLAEA
jgi:hypothetical protein